VEPVSVYPSLRTSFSPPVRTVADWPGATGNGVLQRLAMMSKAGDYCQRKYTLLSKALEGGRDAKSASKRPAT
jgi:hypothetical protein